MHYIKTSRNFFFFVHDCVCYCRQYAMRQTNNNTNICFIRPRTLHIYIYTLYIYISFYNDVTFCNTFFDIYSIYRIFLYSRCTCTFRNWSTAVHLDIVSWIYSGEDKILLLETLLVRESWGGNFQCGNECRERSRTKAGNELWRTVIETNSF